MNILLRHRADQYLSQRLEQNFSVIKIDFDHVNDYDAKNHAVFVDIGETELLNQLRNQGFKVIVSKFYDELLDDPRGTYTQDQCLYLHARDWFRFQSAAIWAQAKHNYIRPQPTPTRFFLMMMNLCKDHRTRLFEATKPYHSDSLYSYVEQGHYLPDDVPPTGSGKCRGTSDQHFYNPAWYDQTAFSLVAESRVQWPTRSPTARFVSEKIFKPIAFQHAFITYSTAGTLRYLHEMGFETFDHVIDESYDLVVDTLQRLNCIELILKDLYRDYKNGQHLFSDPVSKQKILHNYHNFYNHDKLDKLWSTEIIDPIRKFLNA